jgi:hypothetical protein
MDRAPPQTLCYQGNGRIRDLSFTSLNILLQKLSSTRFGQRKMFLENCDTVSY